MPGGRGGKDSVQYSKLERGLVFYGLCKELGFYFKCNEKFVKFSYAETPRT